MYLDWAYFSEIASEETQGLTGTLIRLYLLGDLVDDKGLRNNVMTALPTHSLKAVKAPTPGHICRIWENTAKGSMLRKWALDCILSQRGVFEQDVTEYPHEFVQQAAVKLIQQTPKISSADLLAKSPEYQEADDDA